MIVSHKHKFIFIKTRKTAGTSLEMGLSRFCGPDDVLSELGERPEVLDDFGYDGGRNYRVRRLTLRDVVNLPRRGWPVFHSHAPAKFIRYHVPRNVWDSYFKFAFERNPFDRIVSQYYWNTRHSGRKSGQDIHTYLGTSERYRLSRHVHD